MKKKSKKITPIKLPFGKLVTLNILVDYFKTNVIESYDGSDNNNKSFVFFLSHFHSDHYQGLGPKWKCGIVYCSEITQKLIESQLRVPSKFVKGLLLNKEYSFDGFGVTLLDANHCPGAVMFLFRTKTENKDDNYYLHTGDFRYCAEMKEKYPIISQIHIYKVFLDTTFCNKKHVFPSQKDAIESIISVIKMERRKNLETLFLVGSYVIGKEKILIRISQVFNCKIYVSKKANEIMTLIGENNELFTTVPFESDFHRVSMSAISPESMKRFLVSGKWKSVVGFLPTGWKASSKRNVSVREFSDNMRVYGIPYSEHCSFQELRDFLAWTNPSYIVPTVDCNSENDRKSIVNTLFEKKKDNKSSITSFFSKLSSNSVTNVMQFNDLEAPTTPKKLVAPILNTNVRDNSSSFSKSSVTINHKNEVNPKDIIIIEDSDEFYPEKKKAKHGNWVD